MVRISLGLATAAFLATAAAGAEPDFWSTPAIVGYGRMHDLPNSAYRPDRNVRYRIVFDLTSAAKNPSDVNPALDRVARTVNLYVASGVPLSHLKLVAVAHGPATSLALDDEHYRDAFGVANPNLPLIALLRSAGIDVSVCGQAVAELKYDYAWLDKSVTLSLSALTTITTLEREGFTLLPL